MVALRANQKNKYRALWEFSHGMNDIQSTPLIMQIARSNTCNFKCVYCVDHRPGNRIPRSTLVGDTWERLLRLIPKTETLAFHGISEFMIDPEFFRIIQLCADAKASLSINTNGSVCTPKYLDALGSYPGYISINFSIDAATPEAFQKMRGWNFQRVLRNVKTYLELFASRKYMTWTSLSFVIARANINDMVPFVFLAKQLGVDSAKYYRLHEYGGLDWQVDANDYSFDYRKECVSEFSEEYNSQIELTRQAAEILGLRVELPAPIVGTG